MPRRARHVACSVCGHVRVVKDRRDPKTCGRKECISEYQRRVRREQIGPGMKPPKPKREVKGKPVAEKKWSDEIELQVVEFRRQNVPLKQISERLGIRVRIIKMLITRHNRKRGAAIRRRLRQARKEKGVKPAISQSDDLFVQTIGDMLCRRS